MIEIKKAKPTSPGRRHVVSVKNTELHSGKPFKGLVDTKNKKGCTALWLACLNGHLDVAQTLIMNTADTETIDSRRVSCLMVAFRRGHIKVCKFLVKHVRQFPSDQDCKRYITSLNETTIAVANHQPSTVNPQAIQQHQQHNQTTTTDKDLLKRCLQCMEVIFQAKDKQVQEANRVANNLLKEIESEKCREQNKKLAAQRKREKRKLKKQQQIDETNVKEQDKTIVEKNQSVKKKITKKKDLEQNEATTTLTNTKPQEKNQEKTTSKTKKSNKKKNKKGSQQKVNNQVTASSKQKNEMPKHQL